MSESPNTSAQSGEFRAGAGRPGIAKAVGGPLSAEDLITLNEEIAAMAKAGLPLDQGLAALAKEMGGGRLQKVTSQLADDLRAGCTLPDAMQRQAGRLPNYYAALLTAGIRCNRLNDVLASVTVYARQIADFREATRGALIYPTFVLGLGFILSAFVAVYLVPSFKEMFREFKMKVPLVTEMLFFVSGHTIEFFVAPPALVALALLLQRWLLLRSARGRVIWARFAYAVPIAGTMARSARLAVFTDLLGILVDQSVPLADGLSLAAQASGEPLLIEGVKSVEAEMREGVSLSQALQRQRLVPDLVVWMIGYGERSGKLGTTLHQLAQMYRRKAEMRATLLRVLLPPFLIVVIALFLGGLFIFGLMMPIFELFEGLSGGFR